MDFYNLNNWEEKPWTISDLIKELESIKSEHGDLDLLRTDTSVDKKVYSVSSDIYSDEGKGTIKIYLK